VKILGNYRFLGGLLGGRSPPSQKMGFFKAKGLISGWVGKIRNNLHFRITRQLSFFMLYNFGMLFLLNLVEVEVHGLLNIGDGYLIVLSDKSQMKFLTMTIGKNEGEAIIIAKENIETPRPLTHELTTNIIKNLDGNIEYIEIYDLKEGVYYAKIHLTKKFLFFKDKRVIDSRPSDAIALALRFKSKIYVNEKLLENMEIPKPKKNKKFFDI
jgi:uncharacterized protein